MEPCGKILYDHAGKSSVHCSTAIANTCTEEGDWCYKSVACCDKFWYYDQKQCFKIAGNSDLYQYSFDMSKFDMSKFDMSKFDMSKKIRVLQYHLTRL